MKEIKFDIVDNSLFYKKLDNGLDVYLVPKKNTNNFYMTFTTKYGAKHNEFIPLNEKEYFKTPYGVAHFLEHKMFEQEDGTDPFEYFSNLGVSANAYTSLDNTTYLASGSANFEKTLNYLIDYVQSPYFTDKNVNKEQGIIGQEIDMYLDNSDSVLDELIRYNAFVEHPYKYSIIGSKDDISQINKDILYSCYNTFYHPHNMFMVITGNFDVDSAIKIIEENQSSKDYNNTNDTVYKTIDEVDTVYKESEEINMLVNIEKVALGIKIPMKPFKNMDKKIRNYYLNLIFNLNFDDTSLFYEELINNEVISSRIDVGYIDASTHILMVLSATSTKPKEFIKLVKEKLNNLNVEEEDIKRRVNSSISKAIYTFESVDSINHMIESNVIHYGKVYTNLKGIYENTSKEEVDKVINLLDLSNNNYVIINKLEE